MHIKDVDVHLFKMSRKCSNNEIKNSNQHSCCKAYHCMIVANEDITEQIQESNKNDRKGEKNSLLCSYGACNAS